MLNSRDKLHLLQGNSSLKQLISLCPEIWRETGTEINQRLAGGIPGEAASGSLNGYIKELNAKADTWKAPLAASRNNLGMVDRAFPDLIKARMAWLALQNYSLAVLGGKTKGSIRFNLWNGTILQKLLFKQGFERKPVSLFWYHLVWPLISQKKILMRLVYKKGIYCFYSSELIRNLSRLIREAGCGPDAPALEIAAGDGTLSQFLRSETLPIIATDNLSWETSARSAAELAANRVIDLDAASAIRKFQPSVVICSWPPAGNNFERQVFLNTFTRLYIVIGSRHQFASGNWDDYLRYARVGKETGGNDSNSRPFTLDWDEKLSKTVLPRELDNAVLIFRRKI